MRYFYIQPFKRQYYFPQSIENFPFFLEFYAPYTRKGSILWWLWRKFSFFRYFFLIDESRVPEIQKLKDAAGSDTILAINTGTASAGQEQKTTALGYDPGNNHKFFLKYGEKEGARILVEKEYRILSLLQGEPGVPEIMNYRESTSGVLLQTKFVEGVKYSETLLNDDIMLQLFRLIKLPLTGHVDYSSGFAGHKFFAHGDFCPWNMLLSDKEIQLIDWERAGIYPAGYDLFTYIFQTQLLSYPAKPVSLILKQNTGHIMDYFGRSGITDWQPFLREFVKIKIDLYKTSDRILLLKYKTLLNLSGHEIV